MGGSKEVGYRVEVKGKERVAAVLPLQEHWLPLSNLDLLLPPVDVGIFLCYEQQQQQQQQQKDQVLANNKQMVHSDVATRVSTLKASLAQALVTYYPFSGEVVSNTVGEPELLCNNRGVDFIQAYADVELRELQLHNPDISVERKLVPKKKEGVLCVQVTELKCGGLVLACAFDHRIADAYSANMFMVAWAEMARARGTKQRPISVAPSFRRSLLNPRRPGRHDANLDHLYVPVSKMHDPENPDDDDAIVINRIYYVAASDIEQMQSEASTGGQKRSKLEAFSAYLWRAIGKGAKRAKVCRMGIVVNGRSRLMNREPAMANYFGNVLSIPYGTLGVEDLEGMELTEVAGSVHDFLQGAVTEEHFQGLIDWVEARRPEQAVARIYCSSGGTGSDDQQGVAFVVSSGRGFPVSELEFGWGRPVFGSYHFPWGGSAGYVMPMHSARGGGDWVVYVHLMKDLVDALEAEAGHVFRPLTSYYFLI